MPATLIDGKAIAAEIQHEIAQQIQARISKGMRPPGLATILVGEDGASRIYVRNKRRACDAVGIASFDYDLAAGTSQTELLNLIDKLNADERVDGSSCNCRCRRMSTKPWSSSKSTTPRMSTAFTRTPWGG